MPHFETKASMEDATLEPIAIVGMACRLPGGLNSPNSLWEALEQKLSVQTPKVPASRFNIDAYLHDRLDRPGSFNVAGGYFLEGAAEDFDPTFFNFTPIEAMWMDPQQRKMLEVTYECFESAGLTLEAVKGSNTAVFVGSFTSDYQQMSTKEGDFRHNYAATGVDTGLISARIGNTFDLNGPCFTINTACSSSIYAIHSACHALRSRDANAAIAGGVNLILTVDQHINTAKLGILSPTSTCHTFDASADGYGRAEGAGALYLKRLSDAIRDGDPVRGVIRSSAVNTNGKVPGMGITHPSVKGQERVVRQAYARSNLDPKRTAYVECHGTGTPVGDPIEAQAVAKAMNDDRPSDEPLLIGAIKANIGHSEAASGIFAVMKAALMTEKAIIPGVCGLKTLNPAIRESDWNVKVNADTCPWPSGFSERRAGVSSFGYGGTNGHVVVEAIDALYPFYAHGHKRGNEPAKATRPFLLPFSAHDRRTLERNIKAHSDVIADYHLADLAYTLGVRRSKFPVQGFTVLTEPFTATDLALSTFEFGTAVSKEPEVAFVFTGQGAHWAAMGAHAMAAFPSFQSTVQALDRVLQQLELDIRPKWSLEAAIAGRPDSPNISEAEVAQPICTAIQIAIVDLFLSWGIQPAAVVGHSSGEIAAAYAAGLISAPEAMVTAFLRGLAVHRQAPIGSMLAVGLGLIDIAEYEDRIGLGTNLAIACSNSPQSLTLSGTLEAIQHAQNVFNASGVFARELHTGRAYHSPHMDTVASVYDALLDGARRDPRISESRWRQERARWFSSVTGREFLHDEIDPHYWSGNLRSQVLFDEAVTALGSADGMQHVKIFLEVGPHPALSGPFKQTWKANKFQQFTYASSLVRGQDSAVELLRSAGSLFLQGYPVDMESVNTISGSANSSGSTVDKIRPLLLVDLPPYQWSTDKRYWAEARFSNEQRNLTHGRHDLLGSKIVGLSSHALAWRNELRHSDIPWLKHHKLGGEAVFPAAAHLSMAAEAMQQVCDQQGLEIHSITFRNVVLQSALVVPDTDEGVETQLRLTKQNAEGPWFSFSIESLRDGVWTLHSHGLIASNHLDLSRHASLPHPIDASKLTQRIQSKTWYSAFSRVGFEYGSSFQTLGSIQTDKGRHEAAADVDIRTESGLMQGESRHLLHPSTVDGCLQLIIISINAGAYKAMQHGVVPFKIEELTFGRAGAGRSGHAVAWTDQLDGRVFNTHTKLFTDEGRLILDVKNLQCISYEAAAPQTNLANSIRQPYMQTVWKPDIDTLDPDQFKTVYPTLETEEAGIARVVELLRHKNTISSVLLLGQNDPRVLKVVLEQTASYAKVTLADESDGHLQTLTDGLDQTRVSTIVTKGGHLQMPEKPSTLYDLVLVGKSCVDLSDDPSLLKYISALVSRNGNILLSTGLAKDRKLSDKMIADAFPGPRTVFELPDVSITYSSHSSAEDHANDRYSGDIIVCTSTEPSGAAHAALMTSLAEHCRSVKSLGLLNMEPAQPEKEVSYVIYDPSGELAATLSPVAFERLKAILTGNAPVLWLSFGVNEGKNPSGAMSQGFLRAVRSEQTSARLISLDVNQTERITSVGAAIVQKLNGLASAEDGADVEFWLRDNALHIARIMPNEDLNANFSADQAPPETTLLSSEQVLSGLVEDANLIFESGNWDDLPPLSEQDIDIQVEYASLEAEAAHREYKTLAVVAGPARRTGDDSDKSITGQNALAFSLSPFENFVRTKTTASAFCPDIDPAILVATVPTLAQALNAVFDVAKVTSGDRVLLLPGSLRFACAVEVLRTAIGFELTVVVETEHEKANFLAQGLLASDCIHIAPDTTAVLHLLHDACCGQPNVVIAQNFSTLSQEVWRAMPSFSRFVLHEGMIDGPLDPLPFTKGVTFLQSGVERMYKSRAPELGDLLRRTVAFMRDHRVAWEPTICDIEEFKEVGTLKLEHNTTQNHVVAYNRGRSSVLIRLKSVAVKLRPDVAYLLVGCLGGLGRSLTSFMIERGARDFVFLSRSGADKPEAAALIKSIRQAGANAQVIRGDVSDRDAVARAVKEVVASRPIKGVVHAAMVLQDSLFSNMSLEQFNAALQPKAEGAKALHEAFQGFDLDFFVMTSSISATAGNPGQANYCAANSYLDSLALHRRLQGLAATSLVLPMVLGVGVVAENVEIEKALTQKAMYGIDEAEVLRGFEAAMLAGHDASQSPGGSTAVGDTQIILGLEPSFLAEAIDASGSSAEEAYWYPVARFRHLRDAVAFRASGQTRTAGEQTLVQELESARKDGTDAVLSILCGHIVKKLSNMLLIPAEEFDFEERSIAVWGVDSMIGANLRNWLFKQFTLEMPFQSLLAPSMSIKALASAIGEHLGVVEKA